MYNIIIFKMVHNVAESMSVPEMVTGDFLVS